MITSRRIGWVVTSLLFAAAAISACLVLLDGIATTEAGVNGIGSPGIERSVVYLPYIAASSSGGTTSNSGLAGSEASD